MATNRKNESEKQEQGVPKSLQNRARAMLAIFLVCGCLVLVGRLYYLQIVQHEDLQTRVAAQQLKDTMIKPKRGQIFDANGKVLAKSSIVWNISADPSQIKAPRLSDEEAERLQEAYPLEEDQERLRLERRAERVKLISQDVAEILGKEYQEVYDKLIDHEKQYVVLAKQVEKPVADKISAYADENWLPFSTERDTKREYPYGAFAASVLGFMHADGYGFYGLEKQYDDVLAGVPGRLISLRNNVGAEVANDERIEYQPKDGWSLGLTIVTEIQAIAEKYLENSVKANNVTNRGVVIIMDVNTGAILAMATKPDFDPNQPMEIYDPERAALLEGLDDTEYTRVQGQERQRQWKNKAITELYTPGSVFKVITLSSAMD